jgi:hypothetical protein
LCLFPFSKTNQKADDFMSIYKAEFPAGSKVRIAELLRLREFQQTWKYHHKLSPEQLEFAGQVAEVEKNGFYHGGDVLYELRGVPGIWHEECLGPASSLRSLNE